MGETRRLVEELSFNRNNNMNTIPLKDAMIAFNPVNRFISSRGGEPGQVMVVTHPDTHQISKHLSDTVAPKWDLDRVDLSKSSREELFLRMKLMVEAWHIACRDAVPLANIHEALLVIPEYRDMLSEDFYVAEQ